MWSSSDAPGGGSWSRRPSRARRIRWWLRTGTLLALIGVVRLARAMRVHWEPVTLVAGGLLMVIGFVLPAVSVAYLLGMIGRPASRLARQHVQMARAVGAERLDLLIGSSPL